MAAAREAAAREAAAREAAARGAREAAAREAREAAAREAREAAARDVAARRAAVEQRLAAERRRAILTPLEHQALVERLAANRVASERAEAERQAALDRRLAEHVDAQHAAAERRAAVRAAEHHADWQRTTFFAPRQCNAGILSGGTIVGYFGIPNQGEHVYEHVYALGDLHGDIQIFFEFLKLCNIATVDRTDYKNPNIRWNTAVRNVAVIFLGDIVDRYRPGAAETNVHGVRSSVGEEVFEEKYLERAINDLSIQAAGNYSVVLKLFGNHEFINRLEPLNGPYNRAAGPAHYMSPFLQRTYEDRYPGLDPVYSRVNEFQPGHIMNYEVAECNPSVIFQLNQHVFVHGGISLSSIDYAEQNHRHLYEFANSLARAKWSGDITSDDDLHFYNLVFRSAESDGSLLWDRTFSEPTGPPTYPNMAEYISAVVARLNVHNARFGVPQVRGIVVAHTWPGSTVTQTSRNNHYVTRKNGTNGNGYVIFTDTNASRSFMFAGDMYQRQPNPRLRVRPLHVLQNGSLEMIYSGPNRSQVERASVPL